MAEKCEVWKATDGTFWSSEGQCLAYEMKLYLLNLGKSAQAIMVDEMGKIDAGGMATLSGFALSALNEKVPRLKESLDA